MSKVWRHADGREFPATYHYAPDMPDYHSASVGKYTVCESLMHELGYTLVEREDLPKPKVVRVLAHIGTAGILIGDALASAGFGPNDPIEILAVHEDLMQELDLCARDWVACGPFENSINKDLEAALAACGFGETP